MGKKQKKQQSKPAENKPDKQTLTRLSLSAKQDFSKFTGFLKAVENPNRILAQTREGIEQGLEIFEEMEQDPQVFSELQTRQLKVRRLPFRILVDSDLDSDKEQAEQLQKDIAGIYRPLIKEIQDAMPKGFSVTELMLTVDPATGKVLIPESKGWPQRHFAFDEAWNLGLKTEAKPEGEYVHEDRVVVATYDQRKGNRYGRSLLTSAFWPWYFKKHGWLFWATFVEKFGQPTVVGNFPAGTEEDQQAELLSACESIQTDMAVVIPAGFTFELLEGMRSGSINTYESFIDFNDRYISKVILLAPLVTNEAKYGTKAQTTVQTELMSECLEDDSDWLMSVMTGEVVEKLAAWNYNFTVPPYLTIDYKSEDTDNDAADRDAKIQTFAPTKLDQIWDKYDMERPSEDDLVVFNGQITLFKNIVSAASGTGQPTIENIQNYAAEFAGEASPEDELLLSENEYIEILWNEHSRKLERGVDWEQLQMLIDVNDWEAAILKLAEYETAHSEESWTDLLTVSRLMGEYSVQQQIDQLSASFSPMKIEFDKFKVIEPKEAIEWFLSRVPVKKAEWDKLKEMARKNAFYVSEVEDIDLINYVKEKMVKALQGEMTYTAYKSELFAESGAYPFHGRMRTAFFTNMYTALNLQAEVAMLRNSHNFPYWRYSAILDGKTRPAHAQMHGVVAKFDDPFWSTWSPPNGFQCRCRKTVASKPQFDTNRGRLKLVSGLRPDEGFERNPSTDYGLFIDLITRKKRSGMLLNNTIRSLVRKNDVA